MSKCNILKSALEFPPSELDPQTPHRHSPEFPSAKFVLQMPQNYLLFQIEDISGEHGGIFETL
jgi:hypothetical protein